MKEREGIFLQIIDYSFVYFKMAIPLFFLTKLFLFSTNSGSLSISLNRIVILLTLAICYKNKTD